MNGQDHDDEHAHAQRRLLAADSHDDHSTVVEGLAFAAAAEENGYRYCVTIQVERPAVNASMQECSSCSMSYWVRPGPGESVLFLGHPCR